MEEVPFQVWNMKFFTTLGDFLGEFVKVDRETAEKNRFDVAKKLVKVDSKLSIPPLVSVKLDNEVFKIILSIENEVDSDHSNN
ncbi:hypothetical protein PTKIN_Ptkin16aG0022800 [Pterospermum kingtungense]